jgi:hypothetical protein
MLVYKLKLSNNTEFDLCIDLLDTLFVNRWKSYMQDLSVQLPNIKWNFYLGRCKFSSLQAVSFSGYLEKLRSFSKWLVKLRDAFEFLHCHCLGNYEKELVDLEFLIKNPKELRQRHLNIWHRHFTTIVGPYGVIALYGVTEDVFNAINAINQHVHDLEILTYMYLKNADVIKGKPLHSIQCIDDREFAIKDFISNFEIKDQLWFSENSIHTFPDTFDPIENSYRHTVWLNDDIKGKDQFKAWIEEDDLSAEDCTGNLFLTPNLMVDPDYVFATIIENPNWQEQHIKAGKPLNRWPMGDIVNLESIDWSILEDATIQSIELDEKTLWARI